MADTKNPYADFTKIFAEFKAPEVDFTGFFALQRKNVEAISAANQVMAESAQAFSRRQAEIMQEQIEEALKSAKDIMSAKSPEEGAEKGAAYTKKALTHSFNNMRELAEIASKSNAEVMDVISKNVTKNFEEFGSVVNGKKAA